MFVDGHALFTHVLYNSLYMLHVMVNNYTLFQIHIRLLDVQKKQTGETETTLNHFLTALFIYCL